ncbi:hypothetical protein FQR65_LT20235 [Abscondita terminalis]|nr:hypothetical protein FQR65_LT20235 [Abscondita terminalis]
MPGPASSCAHDGDIEVAGRPLASRCSGRTPRANRAVIRDETVRAGPAIGGGPVLHWWRALARPANPGRPRPDSRKFGLKARQRLPVAPVLADLVVQRGSWGLPRASAVRARLPPWRRRASAIRARSKASTWRTAGGARCPARRRRAMRRTEASPPRCPAPCARPRCAVLARCRASHSPAAVARAPWSARARAAGGGPHPAARNARTAGARPRAARAAAAAPPWPRSGGSRGRRGTVLGGSAPADRPWSPRSRGSRWGSACSSPGAPAHAPAARAAA